MRNPLFRVARGAPERAAPALNLPGEWHLRVHIEWDTRACKGELWGDAFNVDDGQVVEVYTVPLDDPRTTTALMGVVAAFGTRCDDEAY